MVQLSFFRFLLNLYPFSQFLASFKGRLIRKRHSYEDFALSVFQSFSLMNFRTLEKFQGSHEKVNIWLKRKPLIFVEKFLSIFFARPDYLCLKGFSQTPFLSFLLLHMARGWMIMILECIEVPWETLLSYKYSRSLKQHQAI